MSCCQRILLVSVLLSLASVQTACITMPNWIQVSSNDWRRNPPDLARLARCSEIEVAIANSSGSILYGDSPCPGVISGFALQDDEIDKASLARIRDYVGHSFADHLQRAFPGKKVFYHTRGPGFSEPRFHPSGHDPDRSAVCLLSYTYVIHPPRPRMRVVGSTWGKHQRTLTGTLAVIESSPPLLLPRAQAYVPGMGWARDKALWVASHGADADQGSTSHSGYPLDCTAEIEADDDVRWLRPKTTVRLNYATLEVAMVKWADRRASGVAEQLSEALRLNAHGR